VSFRRLAFPTLLAGGIVAVNGCADPGEGDLLGGVEQAVLVSVPARLEAERFERFRDSDTVHEGNCGTGPVDSEVTSDAGGGCNVGWTKPGEWLEYDIQVVTSGSYTLTARLASAVAGRGLHVEIDGTNVTQRIVAPSSGWQAFEDRVSAPFALTAGSHVVRVVFDDGDANLNYLQLAAVPISRPRLALPGKLEAEDYARAFEATPAVNSGNACDRGDGVDKESTSDAGGGCNIGWTDAGEWLTYDVHAAQAGTYDIALRLASATAGRRVALELDGRALGTLTAPSAGWQALENRVLRASIGAGDHELRVLFTDGSANLNYLQVTRVDAPPPGVRLPARIEAEDYTGFTDTTAGNTGGACSRGDDVDKELTSDAGGGCNVGWTEVGERLDYAVVADAAATFDVNLRVAGFAGSLRVEVDGVSVGVTPRVNSGGWQTWTTQTIPNVSFAAGAHKLSVVVATAGVNLNYLEVTPRSTGADRDGDRLADSVETGTGVFVGPGNTGTSPDSPDSDGDGLADGDEVLGTRGGLNLPLLGVSPVHKDILIEYDWFDDAAGCAPHTHKPTSEMLDKVARMFANAPVSNPDGKRGIHIIQDVGQLGGGNFIADADGTLIGSVFGTEFQSYRSANLAADRAGYFHYTIFAHEYSDMPGSSGYAEILGDDLIVSLGCFHDIADYVANTIAHELGHNLNLYHGGADGLNNKPNYNSVMNYRFQFAGIDTSCDSQGDNVLDYSVGAHIALDENSIDERAGVCGGTPIDFNFSRTIDAALSYDVNFDGFFAVLQDYDDWSAIVYDWDGGASSGARVMSLVVDGVACPAPPALP
jgi:hypothetical protein